MEIKGFLEEYDKGDLNFQDRRYLLVNENDNIAMYDTEEQERLGSFIDDYALDSALNRLSGDLDEMIQKAAEYDDSQKFHYGFGHVGEPGYVRNPVFVEDIFPDELSREVVEEDRFEVKRDVHDIYVRDRRVGNIYKGNSNHLDQVVKQDFEIPPEFQLIARSLGGMEKFDRTPEKEDKVTAVPIKGEKGFVAGTENERDEFMVVRDGAVDIDLIEMFSNIEGLRNVEFIGSNNKRKQIVWRPGNNNGFMEFNSDSTVNLRNNR